MSGFLMGFFCLFSFIILLIFFGPALLGLVEIKENQVGIVVKKFATRPLPPGHLIALNGEVGYQAQTLAPGWHLGLFPWQYSVHKVPLVIIPPGEIGLVVAADGAPPERILGREIPACQNYQDAAAFLTNGGEKGRQLGILTTGTYRINTALFAIITSFNAEQHGLDPAMLQICRIPQDKVGIVTTIDGKPLEVGQMATEIIPGHEHFQKPQIFIDRGGYRGLQPQLLPPGHWNLNPWFVQVRQVPFDEIPPEYKNSLS